MEKSYSGPGILGSIAVDGIAQYIFGTNDNDLHRIRQAAVNPLIPFSSKLL
jgi:hypothetical protein